MCTSDENQATEGPEPLTADTPLEDCAGGCGKAAAPEELEGGLCPECALLDEFEDEVGLDPEGGEPAPIDDIDPRGSALA